MNTISFRKLIFFGALIFISSSLTAEEVTINLSGLNNASPQIELVFQGEIYSADNTYSSIRERIKDGQASTLEKVLVGSLDASKVPDREKILEYWEVGSQTQVKEMMDDPEVWEFNKNLFQGIEKSILMATMEMAEYTFAYVAHQYSGSDRLSEKVYPLKKVGDQLLFTNDLQDNSFFTRFSDLIADHLAEEVLELED